MAVSLNKLRSDRRAHARTARLMESEARLSREAWVQSMDASDIARSEGPTRGPARLEIPEEARVVVCRFGYVVAMLYSLLKNGTKKNHQINTTPTTSVTDEQLKRLIDQGVADALAARDAERSRNGEDTHDSGTGVRRQAPLARECTYPDFMKCKPLYFKGTEGVIELT
ncbi:hypothetical protein Tco_1531930 [Tanacetum coccineum]